MYKRQKRKIINKPLVVGDWVIIRIAGMGRDNYQIESIEDDIYTCVFTEGSYQHRMMVSKSKLERL